MRYRTLIAFLVTLLTAVFGAAVATPAYAAKSAQLQVMVAAAATVSIEHITSLWNDPEAVRCLQTTCLKDEDPKRRTFVECSQEHQRRVNAVAQGAASDTLHGNIVPQTMTPGELIRSICFRGRAQEPEATLTRNAELHNDIEAIRREYRELVAECARQGGDPDGELDLPELDDALPGDPSLAQARAQTRKIEEYLSAVRSKIVLAQSRCNVKNYTVATVVIKRGDPLEALDIPVARTVASSSEVRPAAVRPTSGGRNCLPDTLELRHSDDTDEIKLYVKPGAWLGDVQHACVAKDFDTTASGVFEANTYEKTLPYCIKDGQRHFPAVSDFDESRWNFDKDRAGDEADTAFRDACTRDGGTFGIALQGKQVLTLKRKAAPTQVAVADKTEDTASGKTATQTDTSVTPDPKSDSVTPAASSSAHVEAPAAPASASAKPPVDDPSSAGVGGAGGGSGGKSQVPNINFWILAFGASLFVNLVQYLTRLHPSHAPPPPAPKR